MLYADSMPEEDNRRTRKGCDMVCRDCRTNEAVSIFGRCEGCADAYNKATLDAFVAILEKLAEPCECAACKPEADPLIAAAWEAAIGETPSQHNPNPED